MGLHTALDTSGFLGDRVDRRVSGNVDLVLLDIKSGTRRPTAA
jgi:pyruvate formate lyase activating enzyme